MGDKTFLRAGAQLTVLAPAVDRKTRVLEGKGLVRVERAGCRFTDISQYRLPGVVMNLTALGESRSLGT